MVGAPPLPLCAAVLIPNGACRGLRFAPRTYFSSKRRVSVPSHLGDSAVLAPKVRRREVGRLALAGEGPYRAEVVCAVTSRVRRSLRLRTRT